MTDQPLRNIILSSKASGRLIKWAAELTEVEIKYKPRAAIKAKALADFMVECTIDNQKVSGQDKMIPEEIKDEDKQQETLAKEYWVFYINRESKNLSGAGLV